MDSSGQADLHLGLTFASAQEVSDVFYHRFEEAGNIADWASLLISVRAEKLPQCPICWENIGPGQAASIPCNHAMHRACMLAWRRAQHSSSCPVCRGRLTKVMSAP